MRGGIVVLGVGAAVVAALLLSEKKAAAASTTPQTTAEPTQPQGAAPSPGVIPPKIQIPGRPETTIPSEGIGLEDVPAGFPQNVLELNYCALAEEYKVQFDRSYGTVSAVERRRLEALWKDALDVCAWQRQVGIIVTQGRTGLRYRRFRTGACCSACAHGKPCTGCDTGTRSKALAIATALPFVPP